MDINKNIIKIANKGLNIVKAILLTLIKGILNKQKGKQNGKSK